MLYGTRCLPTGAATLYGTRRPREPPRCTVRAACPWHHAAQYAVAAHGSCREAAHDAMLGPPWPNRHPKAAPRVQKQKSRLFCNFFAIADCCELPNCGLRRKSAGNRLHDGLFSLCGDGRESVIAKKLQRCRNFCFHGGRIAPTGRFRNGRIAETGQIMQMCGFSLAASRSGLGLPSDGAAACALPHWEGLAKWSSGANRGALRLAE